MTSTAVPPLRGSNNSKKKERGRVIIRLKQMSQLSKVVNTLDRAADKATSKKVSDLAEEAGVSVA